MEFSQWSPGKSDGESERSSSPEHDMHDLKWTAALGRDPRAIPVCVRSFTITSFDRDSIARLCLLIAMSAKHGPQEGGEGIEGWMTGYVLQWGLHVIIAEVRMPYPGRALDYVTLMTVACWSLWTG
jgi:hypothetical protein